MRRLGLFLAGGAATAAVGGFFVVPMLMFGAAVMTEDVKENFVNVSCGSEVTIQNVSQATPKIAGYTAAQTGNAAIIVAVGSQKKVPPRGWVIAVATAMQESGLDNLAYDGNAWPRVKQISMAMPHQGAGHDHDSVGLFQQRADEGQAAAEGRKAWGPAKDLMTPATAAGKFYDALLKVNGWQAMALTKAAQQVQGSAYPGAYAKHEKAASALVDQLSGNAAQAPAASGSVGQCAAHTDQVAASGWVRPVSAPIGEQWHAAYRAGRQHEGVDLIAKRGTPIRAAAAGVVIHLECDRAEEGYNCNRDGSSSQGGCGWYVDLRHAGGIITRYCHMLRRPLVSEGQKVTAGQQIGVVGTSGHSSGPHLHFEVHTHNSRDSSSTVDPVPFMRDHGAPLGTSKQDGGTDT